MWSNRNLFNFSCLVVTLIVLANACTTSRENSLRLSRNDNDELTEADTYFQQGQYKRAMMKYTSYVYSPFPNKTNLAYARYKLGLSHFMLAVSGSLQYPKTVEETPDFLRQAGAGTDAESPAK